MTKIIRSGAYFDDLKEIDDYISVELCNPGAAHKIVIDIDDAVEKLASFPELGPELIVGEGINSGFRYLVHEKYVVIYQLIGDTVCIYRVFDCRVDYISKVMHLLGVI